MKKNITMLSHQKKTILNHIIYPVIVTALIFCSSKPMAVYDIPENLIDNKTEKELSEWIFNYINNNIFEEKDYYNSLNNLALYLSTETDKNIIIFSRAYQKLFYKSGDRIVKDIKVYFARLIYNAQLDVQRSNSLLELFYPIQEGEEGSRNIQLLSTVLRRGIERRFDEKLIVFSKIIFEKIIKKGEESIVAADPNQLEIEKILNRLYLEYIPKGTNDQVKGLIDFTSAIDYLAGKLKIDPSNFLAVLPENFIFERGPDFVQSVIDFNNQDLIRKLAQIINESFVLRKGDLLAIAKSKDEYLIHALNYMVDGLEDKLLVSTASFFEVGRDANIDDEVTILLKLTFQNRAKIITNIARKKEDDISAGRLLNALDQRKPGASSQVINYVREVIDPKKPGESERLQALMDKARVNC